VWWLLAVWLVHEQVCVAALDLHDVKLATECIKKLNAKFPESTRVGRLRGMALESEVRPPLGSPRVDVVSRLGSYTRKAAELRVTSTTCGIPGPRIGVISELK
jgi:hypothetical protein